MSSATLAFVAHRFRGLSVGLSSTYWFLWAGMLVNRAGSFIVPMMTVYLTAQRGLSLVDAGSIVAVYGLGSVGGTLLGGALADRVGRRTTLLVALVLGSVMMLGLSVASSFPAIAAAAFLLGLCLDMFRPAAWSIVSDVVEPEHRLKAFSYLFWAINLGFAFASSVGGFMADKNFQLLFVADAASMLLFAAIVAARVPETRPAPDAAAEQGHVFSPMLDGRFLAFMLLNLASAMVFFQFLTSLPADVLGKGLRASDYGLAISANGVLIVLLQPWAGRWSASRDRARLLALASLFMGVGFGLTAFASTLPAYVLTVCVWTIGEVLMSPVNSSLVADLSPKHQRGRYQGAFGLTWSLAMMLSSSLSPRYAAVVGLRGLWLTCALAGAGLAAAHLVITSRLVGARGAAGR